MEVSKIVPRGCATCTYRTKPNDVDWTITPCDTCLYEHINGIGSEWPMWQLRSDDQLRSDAKMGNKLRIRIRVPVKIRNIKSTSNNGE